MKLTSPRLDRVSRDANVNPASWRDAAHEGSLCKKISAIRIRWQLQSSAATLNITHQCESITVKTAKSFSTWKTWTLVALMDTFIKTLRVKHTVCLGVVFFPLALWNKICRWRQTVCNNYRDLLAWSNIENTLWVNLIKVVQIVAMLKVLRCQHDIAAGIRSMWDQVGSVGFLDEGKMLAEVVT